jgi:hypothetical protein
MVENCEINWKLQNILVNTLRFITRIYWFFHKKEWPCFPYWFNPSCWSSCIITLKEREHRCSNLCSFRIKETSTFIYFK